MLLAFLSQSNLHALVAAIFVEALLRLWTIEDGGWRLRFRLLALAAPLLWLPALLVLTPFRSDSFFVARLALFAGERWNQLRVAGIGVGSLTMILASGLGAALFLRDAVPPVLERLRGAGHPLDSEPWHPAVGAFQSAVERQAFSVGINAPQVRVVRTPVPLLLCEGSRSPLVVASTGTLERLQGGDLEVAVAHELAHARNRDPALGYALMAIRAVLFFNPAAQWVARAIVDDVERRADQAAVGRTGNAAGLARVITLLFEAGEPPPIDGDASFERLFWAARREGVARRSARLAAAPVPARLDRGPALMTLATLGVAGLVFFVV